MDPHPNSIAPPVIKSMTGSKQADMSVEGIKTFLSDSNDDINTKLAPQNDSGKDSSQKVESLEGASKALSNLTGQRRATMKKISETMESIKFLNPRFGFSNPNNFETPTIAGIKTRVASNYGLMTNSASNQLRSSFKVPFHQASYSRSAFFSDITPSFEFSLGLPLLLEVCPESMAKSGCHVRSILSLNRQSYNHKIPYSICDNVGNFEPACFTKFSTLLYNGSQLKTRTETGVSEKTSVINQFSNAKWHFIGYPASTTSIIPNSFGEVVCRGVEMVIDLWSNCRLKPINGRHLWFVTRYYFSNSGSDFERDGEVFQRKAYDSGLQKTPSITSKNMFIYYRRDPEVTESVFDPPKLSSSLIDTMMYYEEPTYIGYVVNNNANEIVSVHNSELVKLLLYGHSTPLSNSQLVEISKDSSLNRMIIYIDPQGYERAKRVRSTSFTIKNDFNFFVIPDPRYPVDNSDPRFEDFSQK
jgi:hypothetical protein